MILRMRGMYLLELAEHVLHSFAAFLVAGSGIVLSHSRKVMSGNMAVKAVPVRIWLRLHLKTRFLPVRSQHAVHIILHQHVQIEVTRCLERSVKKFHISQREGIRIKSVLRRSACRRQKKRYGDQ